MACSVTNRVADAVGRVSDIIVSGCYRQLMTDRIRRIEQLVGICVEVQNLIAKDGYRILQSN